MHTACNNQLQKKFDFNHHCQKIAGKFQSIAGKKTFPKSGKVGILGKVRTDDSLAVPLLGASAAEYFCKGLLQFFTDKRHGFHQIGNIKKSFILLVAVCGDSIILVEALMKYLNLNP
jgi:hypothetical protein